VAENPKIEASRNLYKVESWTNNGRRPGKLLYAGNLQKARTIFAQACKDGRFTMLTIRHGKRVVDGWARK
jgi:hypothetical protein